MSDDPWAIPNSLVVLGISGLFVVSALLITFLFLPGVIRQVRRVRRARRREHRRRN